MAQPKIFVSHSHDDNNFAEKLVKDLNAAGSNAWLDKNELGAGDFQARINKALANCEWFLLVLSRNALASPWVQQEVNAANARKYLRQIQNLIFMKAGPIRHDEVPPLWQVYNIYDATSDYQDALNRALKDIGLQPVPAAKSTSMDQKRIDDARRRIEHSSPLPDTLFTGSLAERQPPPPLRVGDVVHRPYRSDAPVIRHLQDTERGVILAIGGGRATVSWYR